MTTLFLLLAVDTVMAVIDPFTLSLIASGVTLGVQGIQQHVAGKRADAQALEARQQDERTLAANKFQSDSLFLKSYPTAGIEQTTFAKYGGWVSRLKKMDKGGKTPPKKNDPIFVTDPNDPRLKGFQDSLMLYKEGLLADSLISNKIKSLPPKLQSQITDTRYNLASSPYETPDYNYTGEGVSNETAVISTYPMNPRTGIVSAGDNFIEFPRFNQSRVSGIAPTNRRILGTNYAITPSKVKHDSTVTQTPFNDSRFPGYNFAQLSKGERAVPVTEETFKNYRGVRGKPITNLEELRKAVGDDLSADGSTIKIREPNLFRSIDFYQAPKQPVFYQKPIPPPDTTPNPGSRLQIKSESGSWFDVDSFAPDYSQVRYGNTNVVNPDSSRLRSVPGRGAQMAAGGMIKRADGSYSQRGLWDNIRANKGSGKEPTAEMLKQERKIKAESKALGGEPKSAKDKKEETPQWVYDNLKKLPQTSTTLVKQPYAPSRAVTTAKGVLGAASFIAPLRPFVNPIQVGADLYTAGRHAMSGNKKQAKEDLFQAALQTTTFPGMKKDVASVPRIFEAVIDTKDAYEGYKANFRFGGKTIPDYIAEGGEVVDFNQGNVPQAGNFGKLNRLSSNMTKINGDSHDASSGGVEMAGGERVYTDRIIVPQGFTSKLRKL